MIKEASYALRVAKDGLLLDGKLYDPGTSFPGQYIEIKPGSIAILSTIERLNMPCDLVGKIGLRLDYAAQGLIGLMGIQVDPYYGQNMPEGERLFIRVANLGNDPVKLRFGKPLFTFELLRIDGRVDPPSPPKQPGWERLVDSIADQQHKSWTYITRVEYDRHGQTKKLRKELQSRIKDVRHSLQPVVMFGVFLVAVTILGMTISLMLGLRDTPSVDVPGWVTGWGWIILLITLSAATLATAFVGFAAGYRSIWPPKE